MTGGKGISKCWFWAIIISGLFLPFVSRFSVQLAYGGWRNVFPLLPKVIEGPGDIILGVLSAIPYALLALMAKLLPEIEISSPQTKWLKFKPDQVIFRRRAGIVGAAVSMIAITCFINLATWISIEKQLPGSSTAVIALVLVPFWGTISLLPGFLFGWIMGIVILLA
jgi:hypothetical protein